MKEMTSVATTMMTDEEKADLEREMNENYNGGGATPSPQPSAVTSEAASPIGTTAPTPAPAAVDSATSSLHAPTAESSTPHSSTALTPSPAQTPTGEAGEDKHLQAKTARDKKRAKMTPEQKAKLQELENERRKAMEERVEALHRKLIDRLRPFVEAKNPGAPNDPETKVFEEKMRREADDLKLESFGVELLHTIGNVYIMKATTFMKSKKFLGM